MAVVPKLGREEQLGAAALVDEGADGLPHDVLVAVDGCAVEVAVADVQRVNDRLCVAHAVRPQAHHRHLGAAPAMTGGGASTMQCFPGEVGSAAPTAEADSPEVGVRGLARHGRGLVRVAVRAVGRTRRTAVPGGRRPGPGARASVVVVAGRVHRAN